jgi:hypothetical protein
VKIATIDLIQRAPHPHLPPDGPLIDPGGYIHRVFGADGRLRVSGSSRGPDRDKALAHARGLALQAGCSHYRMKGGDGDPLPLS